MPLRPATRVAGDYPAAVAAGPWQMGDQYFEAWVFEWEDGSRSMPCIPREVQPAGSYLPAGFGFVTVNDTGAGTFYPYVPDRQIRKGPPGCKRRLKYRSNKITKVQAAAGAVPDISTLKLCAIIEDNTTTSYNDARGNDIALTADPLLRTDQIWQPRGRYDFAFDGRHGSGYLRPTPCAIVLAPTGELFAGDINYAVGESPGTGGNHGYLVQIIQDTAGVMTLRLRLVTLGAAAAPANSTLTLTNLTLQDVVDWIATNTVASTTHEWGGQLVPGTGALTAATNLAPTHIDVALCTWGAASPNVSTATPAGFADIAEGMKVNNANFPAGTYVKTKTDSTHVVMSANSTGAGAAVDLEFYVDVGDDACFTDATAHSQFGNMRAYGNCIPVVLGLKQSYLDKFPTEKRDFVMTTAGPTQRPNAAHMFHTSPGGRYQADSAAGIFMGAAPLHSGCVAFYSNWIGWYRNERSGSTGEDQDFRMKWVSQGHGCKSPYSIVSGNNWVGCWRDDGFWIFDGNDARIISYDHFRVTTLGGVGDFAYEAGLCNAAAASDSNDYYMQAHYRDGRLLLNLRVSSGVGADYVYDASASLGKMGIAQMLDEEGNAFGWSCRCSYSWRSVSAGCLGAIGSVRKSDGLHLYQADDKNDKTNCGLVQEFETTTAYLDGADPVAWTLFTTTDLLGGMKKSALFSPLTMLYKNTVASGASGVTGTIYRNQARTASVPLVLGLTGTDVFSRKALNLGLKAGSPGEVVEVKLIGGALAAERIFEITGMELPAEILDSLT